MVKGSKLCPNNKSEWFGTLSNKWNFENILDLDVEGSMKMSILGTIWVMDQSRKPKFQMLTQFKEKKHIKVKILNWHQTNTRQTSHKSEPCYHSLLLLRGISSKTIWAQNKTLNSYPPPPSFLHGNRFQNAYIHIKCINFINILIRTNKERKSK